MTVTVDQAIAHLNLEDDDVDLVELVLYVEAANEWVATRVADTSPAPVRLATLILLQHLWDTQRGPAASLDADDDGGRVGYGFAVPNRVNELLAPYRTGTKLPTSSFPTAADWPDPVERWLEV